MLREGHTLQAVARGLGYHRNSLSRRLNQTGYVVPKRGPAVIYRPEDLPIEAIAGALRAGESLLSLSKAHGVNRSVLRRLMRNLGR
jgi:transposase-like protein